MPASDRYPAQLVTRLVIANDAGLLGDALSGLPFYFFMAVQCAAARVPLTLMLGRVDVASLLPRELLTWIDVVPWSDERLHLEIRTGAPLIRLDVARCFGIYIFTCHMMQAHYLSSGYDLSAWSLPPVAFSEDHSLPAYDFVIAPYSRSGSFDTKVWPFERWQSVINALRKHFRICVVGQSTDPKPFYGVDYVLDRNVFDLAGLLAKARVGVLSIDNGVSHLAHLVRANHLLLYPACLPFCWVRNTNPNALHIVGQPRAICVSQVLQGVRALQLQALPAQRAEVAI